MCNGCAATRRCCFNVILAILAGLFFTVLGVIFGAVFAPFILFALASVIVLAVVLLIIFFLTLIYRTCACNRNNDDE